MKLPAHVQQQLDEAERLEQQLTAPPPEPPAPDEPPAEPVVEEAPPPEPPAPAPAPEGVKDDQWEQRYRTLKGMFDVQKGEFDALKRELQNTAAQLEALKTAKAEPAPQPQRLVTEKDEEAFGSDLVDLARRAAQEVVSGSEADLKAELAAAKAEIARLTSQVSGVSQRQGVTDQRTFEAELLRQVPDFVKLNVDPGFLDWLAQVDPVSGLQRQVFLEDAANKLDVSRVVGMVAAFRGGATPPPPPAPQPDRRLERQVTPGKTPSSVAPAADPAKKTWTQAEVAAFFRDVTKGGVYSAEDAARIEAEIDRAAAEGRIA